MGDIIYALPTIRALGGGTLYLDVNGGADSMFVQKIVRTLGLDRLKFNHSCFEFLLPLLLQQSYLGAVGIWSNDVKIDYDLDSVREIISQNEAANICYSTARAADVEISAAPWLDVASYKPYKHVISRSLRYQSNHGLWEKWKKQFREDAVFVGTQLEYDAFESVFHYGIPRHHVTNAYQLAQVIGSCGMFIGNQNLAMAIAIGLGVEFLQEVYPHAPNCRFTERGSYV